MVAAGGASNAADSAEANPGVGGIFTGGNSTGCNGACGGDGIFAAPGTGATGGPSGLAGIFGGDIIVSGAISAGTKDFKIDHPLDPANKYLVHASVESSFRYQLTVIGQFAQAIVAREIQNHEFSIRTSAPNVKVSWQVTGLRQDAFAKAHPLVVEQEKEARLKGFYIHPEPQSCPAQSDRT